MNEGMVTELWVLSAEIAVASSMIREQVAEDNEEKERSFRRKFCREVNQELSSMLPRIHKAPHSPASQMGMNAVVELANPILGLVELYEDPVVYAATSPPYMPTAEPKSEGQEAAED
jgi:hypothetical protein